MQRKSDFWATNTAYSKSKNSKQTVFNNTNNSPIRVLSLCLL